MNELLEIAKHAALEAGAEIMKIYTDPRQDFGIEKKADNSPLTLADKAAHLCIMRYLGETGIPVLSEEGLHLPYEQRKEWSRLWVVDPLDGTKEFIKMNGEFTVNIALVDNGEPILGVIYIPATDVLYYGIIGEGAWKEGALSNSPSMGRIKENLPKEEEVGRGAFVVVASRSHMNAETEEYINQLRKNHDKIQLLAQDYTITYMLNNGCSFMSGGNCGAHNCKAVFDEDIRVNGLDKVYARSSIFPSELLYILENWEDAVNYKFKISNRPWGLDFTKKALDSYISLEDPIEKMKKDQSLLRVFCATVPISERVYELDVDRIMEYKKNMKMI